MLFDIGIGCIIFLYNFIIPEVLTDEVGTRRIFVCPRVNE
jgi:hypothetical protein